MSNDQEIARLSELAQAVLNAPSERHLENYYITNSKDERTSDEMVVLVMEDSRQEGWSGAGFL